MGRSTGRFRPKMSVPFTLAASALPIEEVSAECLSEFNEWLAGGLHAGMEYMEAHKDLRRDPRSLLPGARTMITCAIPFPLSEGSSGIASYALGKDYHDVLRKLFRQPLRRLAEQGKGEWRLCIDSAPIMERYWAEKSGLGRRTESGMISVDGLGTACFLFELLSTRSLPELGLEEGRVSPELFQRMFGLETILPAGVRAAECIGADCGGCKRACPGGALSRGCVDSRKCLSYLTIEHRGAWADPLAIATVATPGGRKTLFGCDRCLISCPLNHPPFRASEALRFLSEFMPDPVIISLTKEDVLAMDEEVFSDKFRGNPIKRVRLEGLRRNAENMD